MSDITTNETFMMKNALILRCKATQAEVALLNKKLEEAITEKGARQAGPIATVTHAIELQGGEPVMDLEFLVPLNQAIDAPPDFQFCSEFKIENALKMRICGSPEKMNQAMEELKEHIVSNGLTPATPVYTVTIQGANSQEELDKMMIDIYVGV